MSNPELAKLPPLLLPTPVELVRGEAFVEVAEGAPPVVVVEAGSRPRGGYRLRIARGDDGGGRVHIGVTHADDARLALATLAQLRRQYGRMLPCLEINDAPAFPTRGVMLDVSRNKVPTTASLERDTGLFASLKFNHLQLYTEHTFAYSGHEEACRGASPITPEEAQRLAAFAAARGVDLAPNQNCFGHLAHWLRIPRYAPLAETHGDWKFLEWPRSGPFSLCPVDPASEAFVADLLGQLLPCFTSGVVNIGCDETFDVGTGRSKDAVEALGPGGREAVYLEFVGRICRIAAAHGKRPMLWADIALSRPESLAAWPRTPDVGDPIGLAWGYEPDARFDQWCDVLRANGIEPWVSPGTSSWRSIIGRTTERNANLAAAAAARGHGAAGFLVTDWGDSGHHQHWPVSAVAIAHAAQAAWNPAAAAPDPRAIALHVFNDESLALGAWLDALGDIDEPIRRANGIRNASALFTDLHRPWTAKPIVASVDDWHAAGDRLAALEASIPREVDEMDASSPLHAELLHTVATARLAIDHAIAARVHDAAESAPLPAPVRARLADQTRAVLDEHLRLWPLRNRLGGLADSAAHYEKLIARFTGD